MMNESSKRHSKLLQLIFTLNCLSKTPVIKKKKKPGKRQGREMRQQWIHKASKAGHLAAWCVICKEQIQQLELCWRERDLVPLEKRSRIAERNSR